MKKLLAIAILLSASLLSASPVTSGEAVSAAVAWVRRGDAFGLRLGSSVCRVDAVDVAQDARYYAVRVNGGTVVVAGDTDDDPIVAFMPGDGAASVADPRSPLRALLARRAAGLKARPCAFAPTRVGSSWRTLVAEGDALSSAPIALGASTPMPSDVRVSPLLASRWNQGSVSGVTCFNYYTPGNSQCGCVATAMAQVMRYHRFPVSPVAPQLHGRCWYGPTRAEAEPIDLTTQGGVYAWDDMPDVPVNPTEVQRQAIGKLTSDAGIAAETQYTTSSSSAYSAMARKAFCSDFGYAQAHYFSPLDDGVDVTDGTGLERSVLANLDAGLPVLLGIAGDVYGHCVVADGYGVDNGIIYVHINMGWGGINDAWYNLPAIGTQYDFHYVDDVLYNIMPRHTGALLTGRVTDANGLPLANATLRVRRTGHATVQATTNATATGVYAFNLGYGTYDVEAVAADLSATGSVKGVLLGIPNESYFDCSFYDPTNGYYTTKINCVTSDAKAGNSWGNDITLYPAEEALVNVSVSTDAHDPGRMSPVAGVHTVRSNEVVTLTADPYVYAYGAMGTPVSRRRLLGWTGTGDAPAFGSSNVVSFSVTRTSSVVWHWSEEPTDFYLQEIAYLPDIPNYYVVSSAWLTNGETVVYSLPADAACGDAFDFRGVKVKLGAVGYSRTDTMTWQYLSEGARMPSEFSIMADEGMDLWYEYYFEGKKADGASFPQWWYMRNLRFSDDGSGDYSTDGGDPDGDGFGNLAEFGGATDPIDPVSFPFAILGFTPSRLTFVGSVAGVLSVERTDTPTGAWTEVWTRSARRDSVTNVVDVSSFADGTNGFFRVKFKVN